MDVWQAFQSSAINAFWRKERVFMQELAPSGPPFSGDHFEARAEATNF
jgi:hypothetical protein